MMHLIRTALSRDLGGMGNIDLYRHSYTGTKKLIERYVQSSLDTIDAIVNHTSRGYVHPTQAISHSDLLDGMLFSRQSFGRSALLLSGGGSFGMSHVGVLKALFEAELLPRIISGASAGSIVCSVMCTRTDMEMPDLMRQFPYGDLSVFGDNDSGDGMLDHLRRLLTEGSWSDIKHLIRVMRGLMGDITFQEAYNRTRRILNICVSTASIFEMPRLLNYVTAPNVMIWSAVAASCSVPLVFNSSPLLVKDPVTGQHQPWNPTPQHFIDGSVDNDLPMTRLSEMFNVDHFIVSQVNPHIVPFLAKDDHLSPDHKAQHPSLSQHEESAWIYKLTSLARDEALHRLQFMSEMGIFPNLVTKCRSILSQKYSGDITILPEISIHDLPRLLKNPTSDFMVRSCLQGERATWPKLSRIRDRCAIELALDRAVHQLRARVVFSGSRRDILKLNMSAGNLRLGPMPFHNHSPSATRSSGSGFAATSYKRHRRRSGGSVQTMPDSRMFVGPDSSDDEMPQNEVGDTAQQKTRSTTLLAGRKPRIKRSSHSQAQVPQSSYKFPRQPGQLSTNSSTLVAQETWPDMTEPARGAVTSPAEDIETSEQGHWSEADGEQGTEESDPDPYIEGPEHANIPPKGTHKLESSQVHAVAH